MSTPDPTITTWEPSQLISPSHLPTPSSTIPQSLIILNQPLLLHPQIYQTLFTRSKHIIAADGGANRLFDLAQKCSSSSSPTTQISDPTLIIGDLDSLRPSVRSHYASKKIEIIQDPDQYSTDFGKAYNWLRKQQPDEKRNENDDKDDEGEGEKKMDIVVLGGLGGRVDQGLAVLHHLYMFQTHEDYREGKMYLVSSESVTFLLKRGRHRVRVKDEGGMFAGDRAEGGKEGKEGKVRWGLGKHVGIIPMKEASVISTEGLEWDVKDWKTEFGGLISTSNWVREEWVEIETSADVLFTIDLKVEVDGEEIEM